MPGIDVPENLQQYQFFILSQKKDLFSMEESIFFIEIVLKLIGISQNERQ